MRRIVAIRSGGMRFLEMRAKRAASLSWRANFAASLMPIVLKSPNLVDQRFARRRIEFLAGSDLSRLETNTF